LDAGVIAAIIGGIAAVLGLGMAAIAIIIGRHMKSIPPDTAMDTESSAAQSTAVDDEFPSPDDPTAFTDPFAANDRSDEEDALEWRSPFDAPAEEPETRFGFDDAEPTNDESEEVSRRQP